MTRLKLVCRGGVIVPKALKLPWLQSLPFFKAYPLKKKKKKNFW